MTTSPARSAVARSAVLSSVNAGPGATVTAQVSGGEVTAGPAGGVPSATAESSTRPWSTSAWDTVYGAVHGIDAPGASVVAGQATVNGGPAGAVRVSVTGAECGARPAPPPVSQLS